MIVSCEQLNRRRVTERGGSSRLAARESRIPLAELITGLAASAGADRPAGDAEAPFASCPQRPPFTFDPITAFPVVEDSSARFGSSQGIGRSAASSVPRGSQITFDIGIGPRIEDRGTDLIRTKALKPLSYLARNWKFESTPLQR